MTKFSNSATTLPCRTSLRHKAIKNNTESLKVLDYHSKDLEIEANAPPKVGWIVSRPQTSELKFDASMEACKQRGSSEQRILQVEKKAVAFDKLTKHRVTKSIQSGKIKIGNKNLLKNGTSNSEFVSVGESDENKPTKKNFQQAFCKAKQCVSAFAKIV